MRHCRVIAARSALVSVAAGPGRTKYVAGTESAWSIAASAASHQPVATRPETATPASKRTFWRAVADELVRLLLFLLGPADIGPLGPPRQGLPAVLAAGDEIDPQLRPGDSARHITVIPVPVATRHRW